MQTININKGDKYIADREITIGTKEFHSRTLVTSELKDCDIINASLDMSFPTCNR